MQEIVDQINGYIWSPALVYLCLGAGLFYTVLTRFVQVRLFREMIRLLFANKSSDAGISSFQALSVSLSGRVGTGNIAGVAAAIGFGGPGAIFWMWVVAFLGSATAYIESTLGQIYKEEDEGEYRGGPAFYIEKAMGQKWYAWLFAVTTIIATGLLLPGIQSNAIGNAVELAFGGGEMLDTWFGPLSTTKLSIAIAVVALLGFIIFGGVKRIAHFTQIVVPLMAFGYVVTAVVIIGMHISAKHLRSTLLGAELSFGESSAVFFQMRPGKEPGRMQRQPQKLITRPSKDWFKLSRCISIPYSCVPRQL